MNQGATHIATNCRQRPHAPRIYSERRVDFMFGPIDEIVGRAIDHYVGLQIKQDGTQRFGARQVRLLSRQLNNFTGKP